MKKSVTKISSLLLLTAMLAACNTDTEEPKNTLANDGTTQTENVASEKPTENENSSEQETQTNQPSASENITSEDTTLTYTSNGKTFTDKVIESKSEELDYTISHFENYTLEAEEPGVDHLFYNGDDALSMQIKLNSTEEVSFDDLKTSSEESIAAIATEGNYKNVDLSKVVANLPDIQNIIGFETVIDSEKVTIVAFEIGTKLVSLTIYDTTEADLTDAFLQMGSTIK